MFCELTPFAKVDEELLQGRNLIEFGACMHFKESLSPEGRQLHAKIEKGLLPFLQGHGEMALHFNTFSVCSFS